MSIDICEENKCPMLQKISDQDQEIQMRLDLSLDDDNGDDAGEDGDGGDDESVRGSIEWAA